MCRVIPAAMSHAIMVLRPGLRGTWNGDGDGRWSPGYRGGVLRMVDCRRGCWLRLLRRGGGCVLGVSRMIRRNLFLSGLAVRGKRK